jgi:hypothetical protein
VAQAEHVFAVAEQPDVRGAAHPAQRVEEPGRLGRLQPVGEGHDQLHPVAMVRRELDGEDRVGELCFGIGAVDRHVSHPGVGVEARQAGEIAQRHLLRPDRDR